MTRFISTLGFSGHRVTRPIIAYGLTAGDTVVLVPPEQPEKTAQERTEKAVGDIKETLNGVVHQLEITTRYVAVGDFSETTDTVSELLLAGPRPVVCLGAGPTDVMFPALTATLAHPNHVQDVMLFSDLERGGISPALPDLTARIPGRTMDLFRTLSNQIGEPPATVSDLAEAVGCSVSTASRHVDALVQEGLVRKGREKQAKTVSLTQTGRLFARNLSLEEEE